MLCCLFCSVVSVVSKDYSKYLYSLTNSRFQYFWCEYCELKFTCHLTMTCGFQSLSLQHVVAYWTTEHEPLFVLFKVFEFYFWPSYLSSQVALTDTKRFSICLPPLFNPPGCKSYTHSHSGLQVLWDKTCRAQSVHTQITEVLILLLSWISEIILVWTVADLLCL